RDRRDSAGRAPAGRDATGSASSYGRPGKLCGRQARYVKGTVAGPAAVPSYARAGAGAVSALETSERLEAPAEQDRVGEQGEQAPPLIPEVRLAGEADDAAAAHALGPEVRRPGEA